MPVQLLDSPVRPWKIIVADDYAMVREILHLLIDSWPDMEVVAEASSGEEIWREASRLQPDVIVIDTALVRHTGTRLLQRIKTLCPEVRIVAASGGGEEAYAELMLRMGAAGYLLKESSDAEWHQAIRTVALGGVYLDSQVAGEIKDGRIELTSFDRSLSTLEIEILMMVAYGYSNIHIAQTLHFSIKSIESHKSKLCKRLGLRSRAEMIRYSRQRGWLRPEIPEKFRPDN